MRYVILCTKFISLLKHVGFLSCGIGDYVARVEISLKFEPGELKAYAKTEVFLILTLKNTDGKATYWCECDVTVKPPLSLAHDKELNTGRSKVGILMPNGSLSKRIRLYTMPNNFPDDYQVAVTSFIYDADGAIAEREEKKDTLPCK